jgi:hypothetical protein
MPNVFFVGYEEHAVILPVKDIAFSVVVLQLARDHYIM